MRRREKERWCDGENGQGRRKRKKTREDKDRICGNGFVTKKKGSEGERVRVDEGGGEKVKECVREKRKTPLKG